MAGRAHRLFCAMFPPAEAVDSLRGLLVGREVPVQRPVPTEQVHLTVMFIGDTRSSELAGVEESVRRAAGGVDSFRLQPERLVSLPRGGAARLVAAETDAPPPLLEIHRRLVSRLARGPADRDVDGFMPHMTLCRFAGAGVRGFAIDETVAVEPFLVDRVELVESVLHSSGAEYRRVASVPLGGSRGSC